MYAMPEKSACAFSLLPLPLSFYRMLPDALYQLSALNRFLRMSKRAHCSYRVAAHDCQWSILIVYKHIWPTFDGIRKTFILAKLIESAFRVSGLVVTQWVCFVLFLMSFSNHFFHIFNIYIYLAIEYSFDLYLNLFAIARASHLVTISAVAIKSKEK